MSDGDYKTYFYFALVFVLGIIGEKIKQWFVSINWIPIMVNVILIVCFGIVCFILVKKIKGKIQKKREEKEYQQSRKEEIIEKLNDLFEKAITFDYSWKMKERHDKYMAYLSKFYEKIKDQYEAKMHDRFTKFYEEYRKIKSKEEKKIKEEEAIKKKEAREKKEFDRQVKELLEFRKKHKDAGVVPVNSNYSDRVKNAANYSAEIHLKYKEYDKRTRKESIEYYQTHSLDTEPGNYSYWNAKNIFAEVRKGIEDGTIKLKKKVEYRGVKAEKDFYIAKGMGEDMKQRLIAQGFRHVRGINLDGQVSPGGFYLKNDSEKESDQHFYMKHLFAELDPRLKIEYVIDDKNNKRVDCAFIGRGFKFGIEFETGKNKKEQVIEKVKFMNKYFDEWILVCRRDLVRKYSKYVDHARSFCLTPKKAKEKVLEVLTPIRQR